MFVQEKADDDEKTHASSQTMDLFKPIVIDGTTTGGADTDQNPNQDALSAVSGSLRVSTEDVDFPTTDTVSVYEVKDGDTIESVARIFGVSVNTIMWANNLSSRKITKGDTLVILPITGIKHTVKKGDTIASIAKKYKADDQDIAIYNGLAIDATLTPGTTVIVPDGEITIVQPAKSNKGGKKGGKGLREPLLNFYTTTAPEGMLTRPLVGGRKTQGLHGHNGVDLAAPIGTPVLASGNGQVIVAKLGGYNGGYGNMIVISHANGIQTVYAHLSRIDVSSGESVSQGQTIGAVGNTGHSTGPHLHFEVRGAKNPF
jgi:LysM repeat protein